MSDYSEAADGDLTPLLVLPRSMSEAAAGSGRGGQAAGKASGRKSRLPLRGLVPAAAAGSAAERRRSGGGGLGAAVFTAAILLMLVLAGAAPLLLAFSRHGTSRQLVSTGRVLPSAEDTQQQQQQQPEQLAGHGGSSPRRIAFVHKGHGALTPRALAAARDAKRAVEAEGGWYRFLYSLHPDANADADAGGGAAANATSTEAAAAHRPSPQAAAALAALAEALGGAAHVDAVATADVAAALGAPLLAEQRRVVGAAEWAWVTNDAAEAAWFALRGGAALPAWARHVWLVEADVGWTGDLVGALLSTLSGGGGGGAGNGGDGGKSEGEGEGEGEEPDYAAFNVQRADAGWRWFAVRNFEPRGGVWRCYRHVSRASRRLLAAVVAEMRAARVASDEAMSASVCAAAAAAAAASSSAGGGAGGGNGTAWPCRLSAAWQPGHPATGTDAATGEALYRWELRITPERWAAIVAADAAAAAKAAAAVGAGNATAAAKARPGRLYHALKF